MRSTRRALSSVLAVASLSLAAAALAQSTAKGIVYEDANANGRRDDGEKALAGIVVSNQDEVTKTDAQGVWTLPVDDDTIFFVSVPTGYRAQVNEDNVPRFYYVHRPAGSPSTFYPGLKPTGPLPESIELGIVPDPDQSSDFRFLALADVQPETGQEVGYFRDTFVPAMLAEPSSFVVNLGDNMFDHLDLYNNLINIQGKLGRPVWWVIGNHDLNFDAPGDDLSDETHHRLFGPNYFSFSHGGVHFVVLDNIHWKGQGNGYDEQIEARQLAWLEKDLAHVDKDATIVLMQHAPLVSDVKGQRPIPGVEALAKALAGRPRVLALSGHWHRNAHYYFGKQHGWEGPGEFHHVVCTTASGAWWGGPKDAAGIPTAEQSDGTPNGFTIVEFSDGNYTITYRNPQTSAEDQLRAYDPTRVAKDAQGRAQVIANVYYGNERSKVEYRIDDGEWLPVTPSEAPDPLGEVLYNGIVRTGKSWVKAGETAHLWAAPLDPAPAAGLRRLTVRTTDQYNRTFSTALLFTQPRPPRN